MTPASLIGAAGVMVLTYYAAMLTLELAALIMMQGHLKHDAKFQRNDSGR